jgi:hypothetical protein
MAGFAPAVPRPSNPQEFVAMRKLLTALALVLFMTGLVVAAEVTVLKYDKDKMEVTVKDGDKEVTAKINDKTKVFTTDKDGNKTEGKVETLTKRLENIDKSKNKKMDLTIKDGVVTEAVVRGGKKN